jgi:hypothetical protein
MDYVGLKFKIRLRSRRRQTAIRLISAIDADGICLAPVQGLYPMSREQKSIIAAQRE